MDTLDISVPVPQPSVNPMKKPKPVLNIERPAKRGIEITKRNKDGVNIVLFKKDHDETAKMSHFTYTDGEFCALRHNHTINTKEIMKLYSEINRYELAYQRMLNKSKKRVRLDPKTYKEQINILLNKITLKTFHQISMEICRNENLQQGGYLVYLANQLMLRSITQRQTFSLYQMLLEYIVCVLSEEDTKHRQISFMQQLSLNAIMAVKKLVENLNVPITDAPLFLGSMVSIDYSLETTIFQLYTYLSNHPTDRNVHIMCLLLIGAGKVMEERSSRWIPIFEKCRDYTKDKTLSTRTRFMITDMLEARENKWNLDEIIPPPKMKSSIDVQLTKKTALKIIKRDDFSPARFINIFLDDGCTDGFSPYNLQSLLQEIVCEYGSKIPAVCKCFEKLEFTEDEFYAALPIVYSNCSQKEITSDSPLAPSNCGRVFAHAILYGKASLNCFTSVFIYNKKLLIAFLNECLDYEIDVNNWYSWIPPGFSYIDFALDFDGTDLFYIIGSLDYALSSSHESSRESIDLSDILADVTDEMRAEPHYLEAIAQIKEKFNISSELL